MQVFHRLIEAVEAEGAGALVSLVKVEGSSPRESGARMIVRPSGAFNGTIGGGALEWQALDEARAALAAGRGAARRRTISLGPDLAQCCGGRVQWLIETFDARDAGELAALAAAERDGPFVAEAIRGPDGRLARKVMAGPAREGAEIEPLPDGGLRERFVDHATLLYLFGAGHVGRALVLALAPLPFKTRWIDPRREVFPERAPGNVVDGPCGRARAGTWRRAGRGAGAGDDPFASARSFHRQRGAAPAALFICRPDRLGDQARAIPEPDARRRPE